MTAIIVLNWNGFQDTIGCLESLFACTRQDFVWVVVDNGSTNDSVREITGYLQRQGRDFTLVNEGGKPSLTLKAGQGLVYALKDNYGFAKGNNLGIALVESLTEEGGKPSHYLLLNNDTLVEPDFLARLEDFAAAHPQYVALTPQIRYAEPSDRIWNCGGRMFFGLRKYIYGERNVAEFEKSRHWRRGLIDINLITGCALFVKRELLGHPDAWLREKSKRYAQIPLSPTDDTDLLTNRFFFGEEDFDFSLRMQKEGRKMACVPSSVVYHKLGSSRNSQKKVKLTYLHYSCRFIDVRQHWKNPLKYALWKILYFPYIIHIFFRVGADFKQSVKSTFELARQTQKMEGVSRQDFLSYLD
ncbi:MAG: glycosyltransferase family 2 protein [Bacteroides sp.]|nr:glycosyltransferase family 2 protein [Ruminococcus flavefaciens]MCM1554261.1 glycosyltransferase family 2 protein [Bacteroides sp.]